MLTAWSAGAALHIMTAARHGCPGALHPRPPDHHLALGALDRRADAPGWRPDRGQPPLAAPHLVLRRAAVSAGGARLAGGCSQQHHREFLWTHRDHRRGAAPALGRTWSHHRRTRDRRHRGADCRRRGHHHGFRRAAGPRWHSGRDRARGRAMLPGLFQAAGADGGQIPNLRRQARLHDRRPRLQGSGRDLSPSRAARQPDSSSRATASSSKKSTRACARRRRPNSWAR